MDDPKATNALPRTGPTFLGRLFRLLGFGVCLVIGIGLSTVAFDQIRAMRTLERVPRTEVRAVLPGEVNLEGTIRQANELLTSPHFNKPCVYYHYTKERKKKDSEGKTKWETVETRREFVSFLLDDGTGSILTNPSDRVTYTSDVDETEEIGSERFTESRFEVGERVFAFGYAAPEGDRLAVGFNAAGAYRPILSQHGEASERQGMATASVFACWGGLAAYALGMFLLCWMLGTHRILTFLSIVAFGLAASLVFFGLGMMRDDMLAAHERIGRAETAAKQVIGDELKGARIAWDGEWTTLGSFGEARYSALDDEQRARLRRIRIDLARGAERTNAIRARFPEWLLAPLWGIPPEVPPVLPDADRLEEASLDKTFLPARLSSWLVFLAGGIAALLAAVSCHLGMVRLREKRAIENLPTSKTKGVAYGLSEVKGHVVLPEGHAALSGPLTNRDCIQYDYKVEERRKQGKNTSWVTIEQSSDRAPFLCRDDEGDLLVDPADAEILTCRKDTQREGKLRYTESRIEVGDPIYVLGPAQVEPSKMATLAIRRGDEPGPFLVSNFDEATLMLRKGRLGLIGLCLGLIASILVVLLAFGWFGAFAATDYLASALSAPFYLACVGIALGYNDLIFLRQRVRRAWSNIDVALKKRADLVPNIEKVTSSYLDHERELQRGLAAMREGLSGPLDPTSSAALLGAEYVVHERLLGLRERYPELQGSAVMDRTMRALSELENEIALMRQGYNDAVELHNSRIAQFPELILARMFGFREEPLFAARGADEPVRVNLSESSAASAS